MTHLESSVSLLPSAFLINAARPEREKSRARPSRRCPQGNQFPLGFNHLLLGNGPLQPCPKTVSAALSLDCRFQLLIDDRITHGTHDCTTTIDVKTIRKTRKFSHLLLSFEVGVDIQGSYSSIRLVTQAVPTDISRLLPCKSPLRHARRPSTSLH